MDDSERTRTAPDDATPSSAVDSYMARVDARHTHLTVLLDLADLDGVLNVACSAVKLWLLGRDAYRALVERDGDGVNSRDAQAARRRMDVTYARLLEVMRLAYGLLDGHPTRNELDDLRTQLVRAAAALDSDAATTAKAPPTND